MASPEVRSSLKSMVESLTEWPVYDISDYHHIRDVLSSATSQAVLLQYTIADETMSSIGGEGNQGWEETGVVVVHLVVPTGYASSDTLAEGQTIREGLRGYRLASDAKTAVESMSPFTDYGGEGFELEGAWHDFASSLSYYRRDCG